MLKPNVQANVERWGAAVDALELGNATSTVYRDFASIMAALDRFMGNGLGHTMLPTGGGITFQSVGPSQEDGCLEFETGGSVYVAKPTVLFVEVFPAHPKETFLLLELDRLDMSDAYVEVDGWYQAGLEEVLELPDGSYVDRAHWDAGYMGHDESGYEIPIPHGSRIAVRWLRGKMLFVATPSIWNRTASTYDGRHNTATAPQIRAAIERIL